MEVGKNSETEAKPKVLYHASPNRNLQTIEPRKESVRDKDEGPVVFATQDEAYASLFLVSSDDSWTHKFRCDKLFYILISDRKRFEEADKGGSIYFLPTDSFECNNSQGIHSLEWTTVNSAKPINKIDYSSGLDAMIDKGVQVYFVDKNMFNELTKNHRIDYDLLKCLVSENQRREKHY